MAATRIAGLKATGTSTPQRLLSINALAGVLIGISKPHRQSRSTTCFGLRAMQLGRIKFRRGAETISKEVGVLISTAISPVKIFALFFPGLVEVSA